MIEILVDDGVDDICLPSEADIVRAVKASCEAAGLADDDIDLCVRFADDVEVLRLNHQWRGKEKVTDVLSFPLQEGPGFDPAQPLGDIALAMPFVANEAARLELPVQAHILHLIVHATLHLLGYDHMDDEEALAMQQMERGIMQKLKLHDPYPDLED